MDFKQLQSFVTVVECQSFTKAAQRLFVSQPTVSAHIRALEEELQTALIVRTTKSIDVTPKGKSVYEDAVRILGIRDHMVQSCVVMQKRILRVAASTIPAAYILPEILPAFGRSYPQYYFSIHRIDHSGVQSGVEEGRFDLGFTTVRAGDQLMSLPVCRDRMVLITPVTPHYLQIQAQKETSVAQLFENPIILREKAGTGHKRADRYLQELGYDEQRMNVVARANDQETVKNLVAGGMGVSLISYRAARSFIEEKRVLCFDLPVNSGKTIYLLCRKADRQLDYVAHFSDFIRKKHADLEAEYPLE